MDDVTYKGIVCWLIIPSIYKCWKDGLCPKHIYQHCIHAYPFQEQEWCPPSPNINLFHLIYKGNIEKRTHFNRLALTFKGQDGSKSTELWLPGCRMLRIRSRLHQQWNTRSWNCKAVCWWEWLQNLQRKQFVFRFHIEGCNGNWFKEAGSPSVKWRMMPTISKPNATETHCLSLSEWPYKYHHSFLNSFSDIADWQITKSWYSF